MNSVGRIGSREPRGDGGHLGVGLVERHAGGEPCKHTQAPALAIRQAIPERKRGPELSVGRPESRKFEAGRHDADHGVRLGVQLDAPPHHAGVAAELVLPELVAQDEDVVSAWLVLAGREGTAERRLHAQDVEQIGAGPDCWNLLGTVVARQNADPHLGGRHAVERLRLGFPIVEVGRGGRARIGVVGRSLVHQH